MTHLGKRTGGSLLRFSACALVFLGTLNGCSHKSSSEETPVGGKSMANVQRSDFGKTKDGQAVEQYTLRNGNGAVAKIITYGATLTELHVPDRTGKNGNVVLGFDNIAQYQTATAFFGATAGRVANRIAKGTFDLDGATYKLAINNSPNTLHGGNVGFDKKIWKAQPVVGDDPSVRFSYTSPDMEENFPGALTTEVTYTLTADNAVRIDYKATTDKATILNLTNHSYWNLSAFASPTIIDEVMTINAGNYTPVDDTLIPTGEIKSVNGTVFDFTTPHSIGERIEKVPGGPPTGYDHNYVLNGALGQLKLCARVEDPASGRVMEVQTTEPGVQFYTGNFLDGTLSGFGNRYTIHSGFCLETQHYPDSIHQPSFPSVVLKPGETYTQTTIYKFSTK